MRRIAALCALTALSLCGADWTSRSKDGATYNAYPDGGTAHTFQAFGSSVGPFFDTSGTMAPASIPTASLPGVCRNGSLVWDSTAGALKVCASNAWSGIAGAGGGHAIQDEGVTLATRPSLNFTGAGVSCSDNAGSSRTDCTIPGGAGGGAAGTLGTLQVQADGGGFGAYAGALDGGSGQYMTGLNSTGQATYATVQGSQVSGAVASATALAADPPACGAGTWAYDISTTGTLTCSAPRFDQLANPTGDSAITVPANFKVLWTFTGNTDNAFSIHGDGAYSGTGDLVHFHHQATTAALPGADVLHLEFADADVTGLRVTGTGASSQSITTDGKITAGGLVTATGGFSGSLSGNASTSSALAANGTNCGVGQYAQGVDTAGNAEGCATPPGTYSLPATAASTLGGVKGCTGASCSASPGQTCAAGYVATGFDAFGVMQCANSVANATSAATAGNLGATSQCSAGQGATGIDPAGFAQGCTTYAQIFGDIGGTGASPQVTATHLISALPQAQGGTGSGALTCGAGQHLTSNGSAYSCSADSSLAVQDEGVALTQRQTINFTGAAVNCSDDGVNLRTNCNVTSGGGSLNTATALWSAYSGDVYPMNIPAAWASTSSIVSCSIGPTQGAFASLNVPELLAVATLAGFKVVVTSVNAGSIDVIVLNPGGARLFAMINCIG